MRLLILIIFVLITGCSSKPSLPDNMYNVYASQWDAGNKCHQLGALPSNDLATLHQGIQYGLSTWKWDQQKMNEILLGYSNVQPDYDYCKSLPEVGQRLRAQEVQHRATIAGQHKENFKASQEFANNMEGGSVSCTSLPGPVQTTFCN
jgi:hypothetical protein